MATNQRWQSFALAALSAVAGSAVLWGTWLFYKERIWAPGNDVLSWVQPTLLLIGGFLAIAASALLVAGRPAGREVLKLAIGVIPVILVARLVIVVLHGVAYLFRSITDNAGQLSLDSVVDRVRLNPLSLAINLALIVALILIGVLRKSGRTDDTRQ